jgi:hypothetical protein
LEKNSILKTPPTPEPMLPVAEQIPPTPEQMLPTPEQISAGS